MEDTKHERCFKNYEGYLRKWSNHEELIEEHFRNKEIMKWGSQARAIKEQQTKDAQIMKYTAHPKVLLDMVQVNITDQDK